MRGAPPSSPSERSMPERMRGSHANLAGAMQLGRRRMLMVLLGGMGVAGALKGPALYREHKLQQDMHHLRKLLHHEHVALSESVMDGARSIVLFVRCSHEDITAGQQTSARITWLQERLAQGYGVQPTILLIHDEEVSAYPSLSLESAHTFRHAVSRQMNLPYRSRRDEHAEEFSLFDALAATTHERVSADGYGMPAVVCYQVGDLPDVLVSWNREQMDEANIPLQVMQASFLRDFHPDLKTTATKIASVLTDR